MKPTRDSVLALLEEARRESPKHHGWVMHSIAVGDTAGKIADALNQTGQHLDAEGVTLMGYLHDIGKKVGPFAEHPYNGYKFLQSLGYDEAYCLIPLTHSFVNNDPFCMYNGFMQPERDKFVIDFIRQHDFTLEEKIIALCDQMVMLRVSTIDQRMIDIIARHGVCTQTSERILAVRALKNYFDELLGYNLYDLFPEIKANL